MKKRALRLFITFAISFPLFYYIASAENQYRLLSSIACSAVLAVILEIIDSKVK